jgi:FKBP-type peptidyl-prolyl cis-trans isomerase FklB
MKHNSIGIVRRSAGAWVHKCVCASVLTAAAPLAGAWVMMAAAPAGAQTPSSASGAPPPSSAAPATSPAAVPAPAPNPEETSYLFGLTFGEQMHNVGITDQVTIDAIARGVKDGLQGKHSTQANRQQVQDFVRSVMEAAVVRNQAAAKDFLAHNGHEKGVTTTASGLQYKTILPGDKKAPAIVPTDTVTVQYRGKLLDGTEFDSSYTRGTPATFTVQGVIPGWQEALVLMKPGAKWQLFVPPELAYGASPKPGIPGGSLLVFDVELLSVKSSSAEATPRGTSDTKPTPVKPLPKTKRIPEPPPTPDNSK